MRSRILNLMRKYYKSFDYIRYLETFVSFLRLKWLDFAGKGHITLLDLLKSESVRRSI